MHVLLPAEDSPFGVELDPRDLRQKRDLAVQGHAVPAVGPRVVVVAQPPGQQLLGLRLDLGQRVGLVGRCVGSPLGQVGEGEQVVPLRRSNRPRAVDGELDVLIERPLVRLVGVRLEQLCLCPEPRSRRDRGDAEGR